MTGLFLTNVPIVSSIHVYLNGVEQYADTDWVYDEATNRVEFLSGMEAVTDDLVECRYAHAGMSLPPDPTVAGWVPDNTNDIVVARQSPYVKLYTTAWMEMTIQPAYLAPAGTRPEVTLHLVPVPPTLMSCYWSGSHFAKTIATGVVAAYTSSNQAYTSGDPEAFVWYPAGVPVGKQYDHTEIGFGTDPWALGVGNTVPSVYERNAWYPVGHPLDPR